jgi:FG-GAP repeat
VRGARLLGSGESGEGEFGSSVALSAPADTAVVGAPDDDEGVGAAWIFSRHGSSWTPEGAKLTGGQELGKGSFANAVAVAADGRTVMVAAPEDDNRRGAVWVFTRFGATWVPGPKLTPAGAGPETDFGRAIALSPTGQLALIGGDGAVWVFTRSGSSWRLRSKLADRGSGFGERVALSANQTTVLVGGSKTGTGGAVWVFTRSGSKWRQQGVLLTGRERSGFARFGSGVALSADGDVALIGAGGENEEKGVTWVFTRSGSTWTRSARITASHERPLGNCGDAVALSASGEIALIACHAEEVGGESNEGAARVYRRMGDAWKQQGPILAAPGVSKEDRTFGVGVSLSASGRTALIGSEGEDGEVGAAWVYEG